MTTARAFTSARDALEFILAGNAYVTIRSQRSGEHYTFRVSKSKRGDVHFVSLLAGPSNTDDYVYLGILRDSVFSLTKKSHMNEESIPYRAFQFMWQRLIKDVIAPELEIRHEGRCGRCGRLLTVPSSIDRGIGPECAKFVAEAA